MLSSLRRFVAIAALGVFSGCASVDFDYPKPESTVLTDTDDTYLAEQFRGVADQHPGKAGFYPMSDGIDALAARLLLAAKAPS